MVAPITSTVRLPLSPLHVLLPADSSTGLKVASVAVFNQIRAVDRSRLIKKLGEVDALVLFQVDQAIKAAFGLAATELHHSPPAITKAISESTKDVKAGRSPR
jgi:mRNA-degrading endonuclease toxin of MazEF toxin-antitoxin module